MTRCHANTFRYVMSLIMILLLWHLFVFSARAETQDPADTQTITRTDFLRFVELLISRGQLDAAKRLVDGLPEEGPLATDKLFLSAKIAQAEGRL